MTFQHVSTGDLDYDRCSYGSSKLAFRGPYRMPQAVDVAVIGGTETFGKFVVHPFPVLLEQMCGRPVVNLGVVNGGIDSFRNDPIINEVAQRARVCIVQVMGAQGLSNAFYRVHARRNDRFVAPTQKLCRLFPEIDFSEFTFVRHLLARLHTVCPARFEVVVKELQRVWMVGMTDLVHRLAMPVVLVWMADHAPKSFADMDHDPLQPDPLYVTRKMLGTIAGKADGLVEIARPTGSQPDLRGMVFSDLERPAAMTMPGPVLHGAVASALAQVIAPVLEPIPDMGPRKRAPGRP